MNKFFFHSLLAISLVTHTMEQPPSSTQKPISKKELIKLVKKKDARGVLFAIYHQNAAEVIKQNPNVIQIAEEQKTDQLNLSRAGSILLMLQKHAPAPEPKQLQHSASSGKSLNLKHRHHSSKEHKKERSPKEQLLRMIRKKNIEEIQALTGTSSVHFIDTEIIDYARKKYELLRDSSGIKQDLSNSHEFLILQLLKKYAPISSKERRKSCHITKPHSPKEDKP